jgi:Nucleotide modification associated domain 2
MRIRAYTLTVHAGHAPCWMYDEQQGLELLSLANCKPLIRDSAAVGEWIAGITPKGIGNRLAYLMRVGERLSRKGYWARYERSRHDSIYKPLALGGWHQFQNPWHVDEESRKRDLSSEWVLISTEFFVFANSYAEGETGAHGLALASAYSALSKEGMRGAGHFIELPDSFLQWVQEQPRLRLDDFVVLSEFGSKGCGCCDDESG